MSFISELFAFTFQQYSTCTSNSRYVLEFVSELERMLLGEDVQEIPEEVVKMLDELEGQGIPQSSRNEMKAISGKLLEFLK